MPRKKNVTLQPLDTDERVLLAEGHPNRSFSVRELAEMLGAVGLHLELEPAESDGAAVAFFAARRSPTWEYQD